jgi:superfamily II DNA/RNA helicase
MATFNDLLKHEELKAFVKEQGFQHPTPVQVKGIPVLANRQSLSLLGKTGTGKTLSYALPIVQNVKEDEQKGTETRQGHPKAVIVLPTKELTSQVFQVFKDISHFSKLRVRKLLGGEKGAKSKSLGSQSFEILVTGPGRLAAMLEKKEISLADAKYLILDEADTLLDMGFFKEIKKLWGYCEWDGTTVGLISATMPNDFDKFKDEVFEKVDFEMLEVGGHGLKQEIETFNIDINFKEKNTMTRHFLEKTPAGSGMIFCNRKETTEELHKFLKEQFPSKRFFVLHGEMDAKERAASFKKFKEKGGVMICTDIAARGIDIPALGWVLNYDLPFEAVFYIHRSGRVGRGGRKGSVYNFVTTKDFNLIARINTSIQEQSLLKLSTINTKLQRFMTKKKQEKRTPKAPVKKAPTKRPQVGRKQTPRYKKSK